MTEEIIKGIIYTSLDEKIGPTALLWYPLDLAESIRMAVSIKTITMLTTDRGIVPNSLVIMPFPSFNLKGIVKYIERTDTSRRGNVALSSITILFNEADDLIFYKYMENFEADFSDSAKKLAILENGKAKSDEIFTELNNLRIKLGEILEDLSSKEKQTIKLEAFPEKDTKEEFTGANFKIVVCGDPGVGKTSTILRFTENAFLRTYIATLGVSVSEKVIKVNDNLVNLILWDIAGQSKFEVMRRHFYKGAEAVILIFDLTNRKSFDSVSNWFKDIQKNIKPYQEKFFGFILGNKEDLEAERNVSLEEAKQVAENLHLEYLETSAKTGKNVEESFYKVAELLVKSK
ncbi:MAG: Rab family GTPase [Candidatus Thorarchaeota archaeon]